MVGKEANKRVSHLGRRGQDVVTEVTTRDRKLMKWGLSRSGTMRSVWDKNAHFGPSIVRGWEGVGVGVGVRG